MHPIIEPWPSGNGVQTDEVSAPFQDALAAEIGDLMDVFAIVPASSKPLWLLTIVCLMVVVVLMALVYTAYASQHARVEIKRDRIKLVGDFWGREIPFNQLDISDARILDLSRHSAYAPKRRTFGTGLPGYASGWFRLHSGEKALIYLTTRRHVVYLPTFAGYVLLLSVEKPAEFIATLKQYTP
ncbi:PH domain-containing protein [Candidatus Entotheonella palauensis]|uniref:PH domain-containing protein n=1 Tax=Candidatus Entotheonella palauensis TaxID=93172 RepID=UPI000B801CDE|nr:PH domain-containing protein [Candidatus Entotheonella palauensis]